MPILKMQRVRHVPKPEKMKRVPAQKYQRINMSSMQDKRPPEIKRAQTRAKLRRFKEILKENW
jgi:hypothetical protein